MVTLGRTINFFHYIFNLSKWLIQYLVPCHLSNVLQFRVRQHERKHAELRPLQ